MIWRANTEILINRFIKVINEHYITLCWEFNISWRHFILIQQPEWLIKNFVFLHKVHFELSVDE